MTDLSPPTLIESPLRETVPDLLNMAENEDESAVTALPQEFAPELFETEAIDTETVEKDVKSEDVREYRSPTLLFEQDRRSSDAIAMTLLDNRNTTDSQSPARTKSSTSKSRKHSETKKDTRHSSKNEGQHTDRRYLCYICDKLFTRRRSVRDHISKIHGTKTWEPLRSLEIIVEPITGEPIEPLESQVARGGNAPKESEESDVKSRAVLEEEQEDTPVKVERTQLESRSGSVDPVQPATVIGKKRPLPSTKKGMARVKPVNKRARIVESASNTPLRSPSVASVPRHPPPKARLVTQSPSSSRAASLEASASPASYASSPGSTNDDGEIFCICRKGDNHTWMIACDGGCEEWFHGNCVNIRERDGDLIDKYVCPNCKKEGFQTTWKRMCRRKECRKPAKVFDNPPSKYCSRECGRMFFIELVKRGDESAQTTRNGQFVVEMERPHKKRKKRQRDGKKKKMPGDITPVIEGSRPHTPAYSDDDKSEYETDSSLDDDMLPNRGGALRAGEIKAMLEQCKSIDDWRALGKKPATPPAEPDTMAIDQKVEFDDFEQSKLDSIRGEQDRLDTRLQMFNDRERFLELIKLRSASIADKVRKNNPKQKEICGFDNRLAWSDGEFLRWLEAGGNDVIQTGNLAGLDGAGTDRVLSNRVVNGVVHSEADVEDEQQDLPTMNGVCIKNRCQRHGSNRWQKAQLAELRFEQDLVTKQKAKLDRQEQEIRERAAVRSWERRGR